MDIKRFLKLSFPNLYIWNSTREFRRHERMTEGEIKKEICRLYKNHLNRDLDWFNLRRYSEKLQWKKLYFIDPLERIASDKFAVRQWIKEKIGEDYLLPIIGVWERFEDIDFDSMPDRFVLKTTHASSNIIIVKDKKTFDRKYAALMFKLWLSTDYAYASFEMNYKGIPRKIIAEEYMQDHKGEFNDYKFMCFNGKPYFCWVDLGRYTNHTRALYDLNWEKMPVRWRFPIYDGVIPKPSNFDIMVEIASTLSKDFSHVRVDLYNVDGKVYFGELTFCESSGFLKMEPDEFDLELGELWNLPINVNSELKL